MPNNQILLEFYVFELENPKEKNIYFFSPKNTFSRAMDFLVTVFLIDKRSNVLFLPGLFLFCPGQRNRTSDQMLICSVCLESRIQDWVLIWDHPPPAV